MIRKKKSSKTSKDVSVPLSDHLLEVRKRLLIVIGCFIAFSTIGYYFRKDIIDIFTAPIQQHLFFTSPTGALEFTIQVSLLFGAIFTIPIVLYHILGFLDPVLSDKVRKLLSYTISISSLLLVAGFLCAYFIFIPLTLNFLLTFNEGLESLITTTEYFRFIAFYLFSFALLFQMPLIFLIINTIKPISIKSLLKKQRLVIIVSFIISAILTPTVDIFNQFVVAIPIIILYQVSILVLWIYKKNLT